MLACWELGQPSLSTRPSGLAPYPIAHQSHREELAVASFLTYCRFASIQVLNRVVQMRPDSKKPQATALSDSETLRLKE